MTPIPQHVAIIMDGNGRWAERKGYPRVFGHIRGSRRVKEIVREASDLGVKALTLYAFSTENWSRPEGELRVLWKLMHRYLEREFRALDQQNVRLRFIGEMDRLAPDLREVADSVVKRLSKNTGLVLNLAISYGSRKEITRAMGKFASDCVQGRMRPEELTEQLVSEYLWTSELGGLSDVDLVIRTSGEKRVSNFLLWQSAYAEYVFLDLCWPDFGKKELRESIGEFNLRERRFGGVLPWQKQL